MKQSQIKLQFQEQRTSTGKAIEITVGHALVKANAKSSEPHVAIFCELSGLPLDNRTMCDPSLLWAESLLRKKGYTFFYADLGAEDLTEYPSVESLAVLPMLDENLKLMYEAGRYDGPISGLVERTGNKSEIYWFNWCTESGHGNGSRVYSLRAIPDEQHATVREWIRRYDQLNAELLVLSYSPLWPISEKQRSHMRSADDIQADLEKMYKALPLEALNVHLITAWMPECMEELAAVQLVWMSHEDSARFQVWQKDVAMALSAEDQAKLNALFAAPAIDLTEFELFKVNLTDSTGASRIVACDHLGQPPGESFWLTERHRINDLTHLV